MAQVVSEILIGFQGIHDVYVIFKGNAGVGDFDWFSFENKKMEAEKCVEQSGTQWFGTVVGSCDHRDWIMFRDVEFGSGFNALRTRMAVPPAFSGQTMEIRLGGPAGALVGTLVTESTGGWGIYEERMVAITGGQGLQDVFFVFVGNSGIGDFDWFRFENLLLQAESFDGMSGVQRFGEVVGSCDDGDWIMFQNVDFGNGFSHLTARLAVPEVYSGQEVEIRFDGPAGALIGTLVTENTGGWSLFEEQKTVLVGASGVHDVYFVFSGNSGVGDFDWFKFGN